MEMWPKASTRLCWCNMWFARIRRRRAWRKGAGIEDGILVVFASKQKIPQVDAKMMLLCARMD
jgi:hypothetical protein